MPPKAAKKEEELTDIRESLYSIHAKLEELPSCKTDLNELIILVKTLQKSNKEKDEKIRLLEQCVDDLEQYSRIDNIVISGLTTKHKTYARVMNTNPSNDHESAPEEEQESLEEQVVAFIDKNMGVKLEPMDISTCHTLKSKIKPPSIVLHLTSKRVKSQILKASKQLRGSKVYINEHPASKNGLLAKTARQLKRKGKISSRWTRNYKIFIKLWGQRSDSETLQIKDMADFVKLNLIDQSE